MRFIDSTFPLLVTVGGPIFDDTELRQMTTGFEAYFTRGERYAVINYSPPNTQLPDARMRGKIAEWANDPRVRAASAKHCVGSAVVLHSTLMRGAMTAITWLWKPSTPQKSVATAEEAMTYCFEKLHEAGIPLTQPEAKIREFLRREAFT